MLHRWQIDEREYVRHETRRGRRHAFVDLDASGTALVVVDMVPFFVDENPFARGIVTNVNRLAEALRTAGGCVAWVLPAPFPTDVLREFYGDTVAASYQTSGGDGPLRTRLAVGLQGDANVCSESTVRDASTLGYRTIMVADANAAMRDEDLNATLRTVYRSFGDVRTVEELVQLLR